MAFQASLTHLVSQQLSHLLLRVCEDYHLPADEVLPRYLEAPPEPPAARADPPKAPRSKPKPPKTPKTERPACAGEVKGCPCKHRAQVGDDLCHIHIKQRDNPRAPAPPKRVCTGVTTKGAPCTVRAQPGCDLCHLHLAKANAPQKPPEVKPPKKSQKTQEPRVEGRGESPPPVFCQPCPPPPNPEVEVADLDDQMEDLQRRLAAIMMGAGPSSAPRHHQPSREALESEGLEDDPEDWDPEQMESPHSQESARRMRAFDEAMESEEEFLEE